MSYSQIQQDIKALEFYSSKTKGFFVDIGAWDGLTSSNTFLLESQYDWRGICVEANPRMEFVLEQNRPQAFREISAVYTTTGEEVVFDIANSCEAYSGISNSLDKWKNLVDENKTTIKVRTITFTDLLSKHNAPFFIEYLSLDTEGSELEILKSLDHSLYKFGLMDVEHNFVEPKRQELRMFLEANGYIFLEENQFDDRYCHTTTKHLWKKH